MFSERELRWSRKFYLCVRLSDVHIHFVTMSLDEGYRYLATNGLLASPINPNFLDIMNSLHASQLTLGI